MHYTIHSLNCVVRHFFSKNIAQLFIKFTHSFVAIELINFLQKCKKTFLLALQKDLAELFQKQVELLKKSTFW